jgi:hypothetical protein
MGALASLRCLELNDNALSWLPPQLGGLAQLERLALQYNRLPAVPPQLAALLPAPGGAPAAAGALRELQLEGNPLPQVGRWGVGLCVEVFRGVGRFQPQVRREGAAVRGCCPGGIGGA